MASNDGQRLLVLGLGFRQHHTLHMQQVLRAYERLPANLMDRTALFTGLFDLANDLDGDETTKLEDWLKNGGEFPAPPLRTAVPAAGPEITGWADGDSDDENDWPEYDPEAFEAAHERDWDVSMAQGNEDEENENESEDEEDEDERIPREVAMGEDNAVTGRIPGEVSSDEDTSDEEGSEYEPETNTRPRLRSAKGKSIVETKECMVCAEDYPLTEFAPSLITSTCNHKNDELVCLYCLQRAIAEAVTEGQLNRIVCPFCPAGLSREEVKTYATLEVFSRYDYLCMRANPDLVLCLGVDCGHGQVHVGEDPMMICQVCSFKTCAVHKLPWHEGQSCDEFDMDDSQIERLEEAEATAKLLAKEHAQVCPNCHQGVSRIDGCDHMTCRCGMEWCYLCGTSYENIKRLGEEAHAPTCMYNPRRVSRRNEGAAQGTLTELIHGGPVSNTLEKARAARNERIRADMRPKALEAAEKRMQEMKQQQKEQREKHPEKRRRLNLKPAWEEK